VRDSQCKVYLLDSSYDACFKRVASLNHRNLSFDACLKRVASLNHRNLQFKIFSSLPPPCLKFAGLTFWVEDNTFAMEKSPKSCVGKRFRPVGRFCLSMDWVCKMQTTTLENLSVSFRQSTFGWVSCGFLEKRPRNRLIPPKLGAANSFNKDGKTRSSTCRVSIFLRIFEQKRPMKNDA